MHWGPKVQVSLPDEGQNAPLRTKASCTYHKSLLCSAQHVHIGRKFDEGEEEGRPWVPGQYEMEQEAVDEDADAAVDARLQLNGAARNHNIVAEEVRRRLVEFLAIHRPQVPQDDDAEEEIEENPGPGLQYQLVLPL